MNAIKRIALQARCETCFAIDFPARRLLVIFEIYDRPRSPSIFPTPSNRAPCNRRIRKRLKPARFVSILPCTCTSPSPSRFRGFPSCLSHLASVSLHPPPPSREIQEFRRASFYSLFLALFLLHSPSLCCSLLPASFTKLSEHLVDIALCFFFLCVLDDSPWSRRGIRGPSAKCDCQRSSSHKINRFGIVIIICKNRSSRGQSTGYEWDIEWKQKGELYDRDAATRS